MALHFRLGRALGQAASVAGIVALSVLTTLLVQRLLTPPRAAAQSGDAQEIRAAAFVLVGADGTVLGRLGTGEHGNGNLNLYDTAGRKRVDIGGSGTVAVLDPNGKFRAVMYNDGGGEIHRSGIVVQDADERPRAVLSANAGPNNSTSGATVLDTDGKPRAGLYYNPITDASGQQVWGPGSQLRAGIGSLVNPDGANTGTYGLWVRDADNRLLTTIP